MKANDARRDDLYINEPFLERPPREAPHGGVEHRAEGVDDILGENGGAVGEARVGTELRLPARLADPLDARGEFQARLEVRPIHGCESCRDEPGHLGVIRGQRIARVQLSHLVG